MITEIIEKPAKLELVRELNKKHNKHLVNLFLKNFSAVSTGVNVMDDTKSLITSLLAGNTKYYAIVRDDNYHRINIDLGLKVELSNGWKTRKPKNYSEYNICNELAITLIQSIYEVIELGELKRNND